MDNPRIKRFRAVLLLGIIWSIVLGIAALGVTFLLFSVVGVDLPPAQNGEHIPESLLLFAAASLGHLCGLIMGMVFGLYLAVVNQTGSLRQLRPTRMALLGGLAGPSAALLMWVSQMLRHRSLGFIPLEVSVAGIGLLTITGACLAVGTVRIAQRKQLGGPDQQVRLPAT